MKNHSPIEFPSIFKGKALQRGSLFGGILLVALAFFEVFNYSTTDFALRDLLGDLRFAGVHWATILSLAFCGIDFAGIARLFTPEQGRDEPAEVWYLFGAWLLAAGMNASLTWWGVSVAVINHQAAGTAIVGQATLTKAVPVFVAVMVWVIRVLLIGTISIAGERIFSMAKAQPGYYRPLQNERPAVSVNAMHPAPKATPAYTGNRPFGRPEPTYHPAGMSAQGRDENPSIRR